MHRILEPDLQHCIFATTGILIIHELLNITQYLETDSSPCKNTANVCGQMFAAPPLKGGRGVRRAVDKELYPAPVWRPGEWSL
jgi:hypothetical protein